MPYLEDVARLRIAVFREWSYLYQDRAEYEARYLQDYVDCPESTLVLALTLSGSWCPGATSRNGRRPDRCRP